MADRLETWLFGWFGEAITATAGDVPTCVHVPEPVTGTVAAILVEVWLLQSTWFGPATAIDGIGLMTMVTVSLLEEQRGLAEISHLNL